MQKLRTKLDMAYIKAKNWISTKKEGSDQLMVMFIIIAVAAGVAGLLYIFAKSTLLPEFQSKVRHMYFLPLMLKRKVRLSIFQFI